MLLVHHADHLLPRYLERRTNNNGGGSGQMDDPDAPVGTTWTHWLIWNIPAQNSGHYHGVPKVETLDDGTRQGRKDFRRIYGGPCPPPGKPHRYFFKVYALDAKLDLRAGANRDELERAMMMKGHVLAQGELRGKYGR